LRFALAGVFEGGVVSLGGRFIVQLRVSETHDRMARRSYPERVVSIVVHNPPAEMAAPLLAMLAARPYSEKFFEGEEAVEFLRGLPYFGPGKQPEGRS
jgi:hypothetical protein